MKCNKLTPGGYCEVKSIGETVDGEKCKEGCPQWQLVFAVRELTERLVEIASNDA